MLLQDRLIRPISFEGDVVRIEGLNITDVELSEYLKNIPPDDQASSLVRLIEIGLACLNRASLIQDRDFVKRQFDSVVKSIENGLESIPENVKSKLLSHIGTDEGQALYPVDRKIEEVSQVLKDRMEDIKRLLSDDIDPQKESSKIAQVFKKLERSLDPEYTNSVPSTIAKAIDEITGEDGALSKSVNAVVTEAVKPLREEVDRLCKQVLGQAAATDALSGTIEKGQVYEESVVERLQEWAVGNGAEIHHVGTDNRPGDILVRVTENSLAGVDLTIVIEARDREVGAGRKPINDSMDRSMTERSADYGIYLSNHRDGLAKEIGEWAEGEASIGSWVATTDDNLMNAVRFLLLNHRIATMKSERPEIDIQAIEPQLDRIRTSLRRITNINKRVTSIRQDADYITQEGDALRDEVRGAILQVEDSLRIVGAP